MYHEVYERFLKQEAGNNSVDCASDGAILVLRNGVRPASVRLIESGEQFTCNVQHFFESQCIHE